MATNSENLIFQLLANKAKVDLTKNFPSHLPETVAPPQPPPTLPAEHAPKTGFWKKKFEQIGDQDDIPPSPDSVADELPQQTRSIGYKSPSKSASKSRPKSHRRSRPRSHRRSRPRSHPKSQQRSRRRPYSNAKRRQRSAQRSPRRSNRRSYGGSPKYPRSSAPSLDTRLPDTETEIRRHYIDKLEEIYRAEHGDSCTFDFEFYNQLSTRELAFRYSKKKKKRNKYSLEKI